MLKLIPLGGLGEVGRNLMVLEANDERLIVDCGVSFPRADQLGVDVIAPDLTFLRERPETVKGVVLTHAHEDHLGALTLLLRDFDVPVLGTPFTLAAAKHRLTEAGQSAELREFEPRARVRVGSFEVEPFRVTHSIPDAVGLVLRAEGQTVVHTGDFKLDGLPIDGQPTDLSRLEELGAEGVDVLLSDSTNSEVAGTTGSERVVEAAFERWLRTCEGAAAIALFGSHLHRVVHAVGLAQRLGRRVVILGRSLQRNVELAQSAQLLRIPDGVLLSTDRVAEVPRSKLLILCTGAQGEVRSGLSSLVEGLGGQLMLGSKDLVIVSARAIPGNEPLIGAVVNRLLARGVTVVTPAMDPAVHVSGHASRDEQRKVLEVTRPKAFVPIHGEVRHLRRHAALAQDVGLGGEQIRVITDGDVLGFEGGRLHDLGRVPSGLKYHRRESPGEITETTLLERRMIAEAGLVTIVAVLQRLGGRVLHTPTAHGQGLSSDESAVLSLAAEGAALELKELTEAARGDDQKAREALVRGVRRVYRQVLGARPTVQAVVVRV